MAEVARTASEAGRAALRTLEIDERTRPALYSGRPGAGMTWSAVPAGPDELGDHVGLKLPPGAIAQVQGSGTTRIVRTIKTTGGADEPTVVQDGFIMIQHVTTGLPLEPIYLDCREEASEGDEQKTGPCEAEIRTEAKMEGDRFLISIKDVRAEVDSTQGLFLTVPRYPAETTIQADALELHEGGMVPQGQLAEDLYEEVRFPIPAGDYRGLFQSIRDRSLFLFLGVFVVGTVALGGPGLPLHAADPAARRRASAGCPTATSTSRSTVRGSDEIGPPGPGLQRDDPQAARQPRALAGAGPPREALGAGPAGRRRGPRRAQPAALDRPDAAAPARDLPPRGRRAGRGVRPLAGDHPRRDPAARPAGGQLPALRPQRAPRARAGRPAASCCARPRAWCEKEAEWRRIEVELEIDDDGAAGRWPTPRRSARRSSTWC